MKMRAIAVMLVFLVVTVLQAAPAAATMPGKNGRIAFNRNGDIYTAAANGTGVKRLTTYGGGASNPKWSPDGRKIAFVRQGWIWTMNADGSAKARRIHGTAPSWSPDGRYIAFVGTNSEYHDMGDGWEWCYWEDVGIAPWTGGGGRFLDGTNAGSACSWGVVWRSFGPTTSWSPDGSRILYSYNETDEAAGYGVATEISEAAVPYYDLHVNARWHKDADPGYAQPQLDYAPTRDNYVFASDVGSADGLSRLYVFNRSGTYRKRIGGNDTNVSWPVHSPDGKQVLYTKKSRGYAIRRVTLGSTAAPATILTNASQPDWQRLP